MATLLLGDLDPGKSPKIDLKKGQTFRHVFGDPGITILPKIMIPNQLQILNNTILPALSDTHISLLKRNKNSAAIASFEEFVLEKLKVTIQHN